MGDGGEDEDGGGDGGGGWVGDGGGDGCDRAGAGRDAVVEVMLVDGLTGV